MHSINILLSHCPWEIYQVISVFPLYYFPSFRLCVCVCVCVVVFGCLSLDASYCCPLFNCQVGDVNMDSFVLVLNMYLFIMLFVRWMRNYICVFFVCVWLMNDNVLCITSTCYDMEELLYLLVFCISSMIPLLHTNG